MVDREEDPSVWARPTDSTAATPGPPSAADETPAWPAYGPPAATPATPGPPPAADESPAWPAYGPPATTPSALPGSGLGPGPQAGFPPPAYSDAAPPGYGQAPGSPPAAGYGQPTGYGPGQPGGHPPAAGYGQPSPAAYGQPIGYGPAAHQAPGHPAGTGAVSIGRIEPVAGTPYALAIVKVPPVRSGPAIGAMVAGIASIVVSFVVFCFGIGGADAGWGALVAGAFAILALLLGVGAVVVAAPARRAILYSGGTLGGRGVAQTGLICGWIGIGLTVLAFLAALLAGTASS